jgi:hypothetical protein
MFCCFPESRVLDEIVDDGGDSAGGLADWLL